MAPFVGPSRGLVVVAWTGIATFAVSAAFFLYTLLVTFATPAPPATGDGWAGPVLTNLLLYAAFGLHHSLFARQWMRARVQRAGPPGIERAVYVWTASALLVALCRLWLPVPGVAWDLRAPWGWLIRVAQLGGAALLVRSVRAVDGLALIGIRQLTAHLDTHLDTGASPAQAAPALEVRGPYGWVRHPMHLGTLLVVCATPSMTLTHLTFAAATLAYVLVAIPFEERSLMRQAPEAYAAYAQQVRWRLVPWVY